MHTQPQQEPTRVASFTVDGDASNPSGYAIAATWFGWLPGIYADRDAALIALGVIAGGEPHYDLEHLRNHINRGQKRHINRHDLEHASGAELTWGSIDLPGTYADRDAVMMAWGYALTGQKVFPLKDLAEAMNAERGMPVTARDIEIAAMPHLYTVEEETGRRTDTADQAARDYGWWAVPDADDPRLWHAATPEDDGAVPDRLRAMQHAKSLIIRVRGHAEWPRDDDPVHQIDQADCPHCVTAPQDITGYDLPDPQDAPRVITVTYPCGHRRRVTLHADGSLTTDDTDPLD